MTRDPYPLVSVVTPGHNEDKHLAGGKNVMDVACDAAEIEKAIRKQIIHGKYNHNPLFGDGKAGRKIADVLATVQLGSPQKQFFDLNLR
jgi:hypothetical protein